MHFSVVWLAHTEELCDQAAEEITAAWEILGNRPATVFRHYGPYCTDLSDVTSGFLIAGLQLLYSHSTQYSDAFVALAGRVGLVVMDEAHQAIAPTYEHVLRMLAPSQRSKVLGLTATPGRSWLDVEQDRQLAAFFSHQKVTLEVPGYNSPITYLQDAGYLSRIEYIRLPYTPHSDIALTDDESRLLVEQFQIAPRILTALGRDNQRNLLILNEVLTEVDNGSKILLFACSVEHAELLTTILKSKGVAIESVTSKTPRDKRRQYIQQYKTSEGLQILANYGVLTTGFDAPKTDVAIIARPTQSVVLFSQMVGRAARGLLVGGTEECRIITVVDDLPGFRDLSDGFEYWDDVWEPT